MVVKKESEKRTKVIAPSIQRDVSQAGADGQRDVDASPESIYLQQRYLGNSYLQRASEGDEEATGDPSRKTGDNRQPHKAGRETTSGVNASSIRVHSEDPSPKRAQRTADQARRLAPRLGLADRQLDLHLDGTAGQQLRTHRARGVMADGAVFLNPSTFNPDSSDGRAVLAHEMTHVAQRNRSATSGMTNQRAQFAAEAEARYVGRAFSVGGPIRRPAAALPTRIALDDPTEDELERVFENPLFMVIDVHRFGFRMLPGREQQWLAGVDKTVQGFAAVFKALVTHPSYNSATALAAWRQLHFQGEGRLEGDANQGETVHEFNVPLPDAINLLRWISREEGVELEPSVAERIPLLEEGGIIERAFEVMNTMLGEREQTLPFWYTRRLFRFLMVRVDTLRTDLIDAHRTGDADAFEAAVNNVHAALLPGINALNTVRRDERAVSHPVYRILFNLPALMPHEQQSETSRRRRRPSTDVTRARPVDENHPVDGETVRFFLLFCLASNDLVRMLMSSRWAVRLDALNAIGEQLVQVRIMSDVGPVLSEPVPGVQALRANHPPYPCHLSVSPPLEPGYWDVAAGTTHNFIMNIDSYDPAMPFGLHRFRWEVFRVPVIAGRTGTRPARSEVFRLRADREVEYFSDDVERLTEEWGEPQEGVVESVAVHRAIRTIGHAFDTWVSEPMGNPGSERQIAVPDPGLYVVRCIMTQAEIREDATLIRAPSVAWLPVHARTPAELARVRMNVAAAEMRESESALTDLEARLGDASDAVDADTTLDLSDEETARLMAHRDLLNLQLYGSAHDVLTREGELIVARLLMLLREAVRNRARQVHDNADVIMTWDEVELASDLDTLLRSRRLSDYLRRWNLFSQGFASDEARDEATRLRDRLRDIVHIIDEHDARLASHTGEERGGEHTPFRVPAMMVNEQGRVIHLLLEAMLIEESNDRFSYYVSDATQRSSGGGDGQAENRVDAIAAAVEDFLEDTSSSYGRGYCRVRIPSDEAGGWSEREIEVNANPTVIAMEVFESVSMVVSLAAIAAVPLVGAGALAILVPVGVIGIVPPVYRLIDRTEQHTRRWDMATAMDLVDILSSVSSAVGSLRLVGRLGRAMVIAGFGIDGAGVVVAQANLINQIEQIRSDTSLSEVEKRARITSLVGQELFSQGISAGTALMARAAESRRPLLSRGGTEGTGRRPSHRSADTDAPSSPELQQRQQGQRSDATADAPETATQAQRETPGPAPQEAPAADVYLTGPPTGLRRISGLLPEGTGDTGGSAQGTGRTAAHAAEERAVLRALGPDIGVPIFYDDTLNPGTVRVCYALSRGLRLIDNIHIRVAPGTDADTVAVHRGVVRTMQNFTGLTSRIRRLILQVQAFFNGRPYSEVGSLVWEAELEVSKLRQLHNILIRRGAAGDISQRELRVRRRRLEGQIEHWEQVVREGPQDQGRGYVAAEGERRVDRPDGHPECPRGYEYIENSEGNLRLQPMRALGEYDLHWQIAEQGDRRVTRLTRDSAADVVQHARHTIATELDLDSASVDIRYDDSGGTRIVQEGEQYHLYLSGVETWPDVHGAVVLFRDWRYIQERGLARGTLSTVPSDAHLDMMISGTDTVSIGEYGSQARHPRSGIYVETDDPGRTSNRDVYRIQTGFWIDQTPTSGSATTILSPGFVECTAIVIRARLNDGRTRLFVGHVAESDNQGAWRRIESKVIELQSDANVQSLSAFVRISEGDTLFPSRQHARSDLGIDVNIQRVTDELSISVVATEDGVALFSDRGPSHDMIGSWPWPTQEEE